MQPAKGAVLMELLIAKIQSGRGLPHSKTLARGGETLSNNGVLSCSLSCKLFFHKSYSPD
jgi:hypothetical protein